MSSVQELILKLLNEKQAATAEQNRVARIIANLRDELADEFGEDYDADGHQIIRSMQPNVDKLAEKIAELDDRIQKLRRQVAAAAPTIAAASSAAKAASEPHPSTLAAPGKWAYVGKIVTGKQGKPPLVWTTDGSALSDTDSRLYRAWRYTATAEGKDLPPLKEYKPAAPAAARAPTEPAPPVTQPTPQASQPADTDAIAALMQRINDLERQMQLGSTIKPTTTPTAPVKPQPSIRPKKPNTLPLRARGNDTVIDLHATVADSQPVGTAYVIYALVSDDTGVEETVSFWHNAHLREGTRLSIDGTITARHMVDKYSNVPRTMISRVTIATRDAHEN